MHYDSALITSPTTQGVATNFMLRIFTLIRLDLLTGGVELAITEGMP